MPIAKIPGLQINYRLDGPLGAPTLALSHSLGATLAMWDPQIASFAQTFRVLRYDTRGHGQTAATPGEYSIELLAADVLALLDTLKIDSLHFCGLSMGGMIGMWLAANAPLRIGKLVLCNTAAKIGSPETWNPRIAAVKKDGMPGVASVVIERWFTPEFRSSHPAAVASAQKMLQDTDPHGYASACAAVRDFDFREKLAGIRSPTLVISGAHDPVTPPADGKTLAREIPAAGYVELNAAHLSNIGDAERFNAEVCAFLKR